MKINENKLLRKLFESEENVVINNGDRFHLEDYIEYDAKPGLIVALLKDPDCEGCIQNLPIGAVDQFRFMNVTNEDAIVHKEKNNGKTYDMILKEYQGQKSQILEQWKKTNSDKLNGLMEKYGDNFIGLDIVQNSKQIQHKEEKPTEDEKKDSDTEDKGRDVSEMEPIQEDDTIDEGLGDFARKVGNTFKSLNRKVDTWSTELENKVLNKIGDVLSSPVTKKTIKEFIVAMQKANQAIEKSKGSLTEEDIYIKVNDPNKGKMNCNLVDFAENTGIDLIKKAVGNQKYLMFLYSDVSDAVSVAKVREVLSKKIKRISRQLHGMICWENPNDEPKKKDIVKQSIEINGDESGLAAESEDLELTSSSNIKSDFSNLIHPIIKIEFDDEDTIWLTLDKISKEKKEQKAKDQLFT